MPGALISLRGAQIRSRDFALSTAILTLLAVVAVDLVAEVTFPLLTTVRVADIRWALIAASAVVAAPVSAAILRLLLNARHERAQLAIREDLLRAAHQYAKQGYWEFDMAAGRFHMSDTIHQLLGDPEKKLHLTLPVLLAMAHPEDRDRLAAAMTRMLEQGGHEEIEYRIFGLDGKQRTFWVAGTRRLAVDGTPAGAFGFSQDITERKEIEAALRESEDHYRHAVELSPLIPWVEDAAGNTLELSSRWFELTGLPVENSFGTGWTDTIHPDDLGMTESTWRAALQTGEPYDVEHRVRIADGSYRWFRSRASARRNDEGEITRWYGSVEDIHARKLTEIALRESEAFANSILENSSDGIEVIALSGRLEYINMPGRRLYEIEESDYSLEEDWCLIWPDEFRSAAEEALARARAGHIGRLVGFCATAKGTPKWWDVSLSPIPGPDGRPARLLAVSRDITLQKLAQEELEHTARHDGLTGLLNRPYFRHRLEQQLARSTSQGRTALLFLDLDEFKSVNDTLGHPAGDRMLQEAALRLQTCVRATDPVARFGGDEFAILQGDITCHDDIESLATRVIGCLSAPYLLDGREVVVGVSVGIALSDTSGMNADDLLKKADLALYKAKADGRGVYRVFDPGLEEEARINQTLKSDLRDALARGEFRIFFQPVVEFGSLQVTAFEALLRWSHPSRGLLSPDDFISCAEETGAIEQIGSWVLEEACFTAASWPEEISVSVNLSSRQFRDGTLVETVSRALLASGLPAHRLTLEITESLSTLR